MVDLFMMDYVSRRHSDSAILGLAKPKDLGAGCHSAAPSKAKQFGESQETI
jgi:hypothetical protein